MKKDRADLTREQAHEFRRQQHAEASAKGYLVSDCILEVGDRPNDIAPNGLGPRSAIIDFAKEMAERGATYSQVIGQVVTKGDGNPYKIREADLLGYVVANGYCTLQSPSEKSWEPVLVLSTVISLT